MAAAALVLAVAAIYAQTGRFDFVNFDDGEYVAQNPVVAAGLTAHGISWAFSSQAANWHPLTWLSHMADVQLFGMSPGAHHLVNAALHAAAVVALLLVVASATGRVGPAFLTAILVAVHPLNVESVAWISERKNVLSTLLWFATMGAYVGWTRRRGTGRYVLVLVVFALGLLAKPMLVTLPVVLLLLDLWPLGRLTLEGAPRDLWRRARPLVVEKVPLLAMSIATSIMTWRAQSSWNAMGAEELFPLGDRVRNTVTSASAYLLNMVWPTGLASFYPHPSLVAASVPWAPAIGSLVALALISALALRFAKTRPYVLIGWLWYLITLLPVIGLVQVGPQARADRYTYVPLVGIFLAVAWAASDLEARSRGARAFASAAAFVAVLALGIAGWRQTQTWRDSRTLAERALRVTQRNWLAWNNLGTFRLSRGEPAEALPCFRESIAIKSDYADAHYNLGLALAQLGRPGEAAEAYTTSLRLDPANADGHVNLGNVCLELARPSDALHSYGRALELRPDDPHALYGATVALATVGDRAAAMRTFERLQSVSPEFAAQLSRRFAGAR